MYIYLYIQVYADIFIYIYLNYFEPVSVYLSSRTSNSRYGRTFKHTCASQEMTTSDVTNLTIWLVYNLQNIKYF